MNKFFFISIIVTVTIFGCKQKDSNLASQSTNAISQLIVDSLYSESLQEYRYFNIYLPSGYSRENNLPVVYMADGQFMAIESKLFKSGLDSLFTINNVRKAVIIGINSKTDLIEEGGHIAYRHYEYTSALKGRKNSKIDKLENWYTNHMAFFTKEASAFAEKKYGVSKQRKDKIFYGASNGGNYGITLGIEHPQLFKYLIVHSSGAEIYNNIDWDTTQYTYPKFYIAYGDTNDMSEGSIKLDSLLTAYNYKHELIVYEGGHDVKIWSKLMLHTLKEILSE